MHALSQIFTLFTWLRCLAFMAMLLGAANLALAAKTYSDNGDGTVTDPTTGLVWMRCALGQTWNGATCTGTTSNYTFDQANALTGMVTFAGQSDWRLPNIRELQTIVDRTVRNPAIDSKAFPATPATVFGSASDNGNGSFGAWLVDFGYGKTDYLDKKNGRLVRLVRAGQSLGLLSISRPDTGYVDQGDGTTVHVPTRLVWQRCAVGQVWNGSTCDGTASTWSWGAATLLTSSFAGQTDWRLPTEDELLSLVDYSKVPLAINSSLFPNTAALGFWSASADASYADSAWGVYFDGGFASDWVKSTGYRVRLVRAGSCSGPLVLGLSTSGPGQIASRAYAGMTCDTVAGATGYFAGDVVTLTASPAVNLVSWGGACAGTAATCTVTMDAAKTVSAIFSDAPLVLKSGWNLVGNGQNQPLVIATLFGDIQNVTTVWKWDVAKTGWQFYAPSMDTVALQSYTTSKGYGVLTSINPGEGFWVNAIQPFSVTQPSGSAITGNDLATGKPYALKPNWNLVAVGTAMTPSDFNKGLSATPPATSTIPINLTTLWAWDNPLSKWYFYSPQLEGQSGTALFDYTASKGYLDFTTTGKLLGQGMGFWVNRP